MKVYSSRYSTIEVEKEEQLLSVVWLKESIELSDDEVKKEISKIFENAVIHSIKNIVVDVRDYPFRNNKNIQHWINHEYIPKIIERGVERYAIIVDEMITSQFEHLEEEEDIDIMQVKYFTDPNSALQWMK